MNDHLGDDRPDVEHPELDGGADVATLLRSFDLGARDRLDVERLMQAAARRRRARLAERSLAIAATVALVAGVGVGVGHLRSPSDDVAAAVIDLPRTVLGPDSAYPYGVPVGTPGGKPTVVVWNDPQSPLGGQFDEEAGAKLRALAEDGRIYLVVRPATFLDAAHPESDEASLRAVSDWGCVLDAEPGNVRGTATRFLDLVLTHQPAVEGAGWTDAQLAEFASETVGRAAPFGSPLMSCLGSGRYRAWAQASQAQLTRLGVPGVPTVYVDGREVPHDGTTPDWESFVADPAAWIAARS